jgi:hypothetical protein
MFSSSNPKDYWKTQHNCILENKLLPNCLVTRNDILAAEDIFGLDVIGSLKGETIRHSTEYVEIKFTEILATIMSRCRDVMIGGDIMG